MATPESPKPAPKKQPPTAMDILAKKVGLTKAREAMDILELHARRLARDGEVGAICFNIPGGEFTCVVNSPPEANTK